MSENEKRKQLFCLFGRVFVVWIETMELVKYVVNREQDRLDITLTSWKNPNNKKHPYAGDCKIIEEFRKLCEQNAKYPCYEGYEKVCCSLDKGREARNKLAHEYGNKFMEEIRQKHESYLRELKWAMENDPSGTVEKVALPQLLEAADDFTQKQIDMLSCYKDVIESASESFGDFQKQINRDYASE